MTDAVAALNPAQAAKLQDLKTRRPFGLHHLPFIGRKTLPDTATFTAKTVSGEATKQLAKSGLWAGISGLFGRLFQLSSSNKSIENIAKMADTALKGSGSTLVTDQLADALKVGEAALKSPLKAGLAWLGALIGTHHTHGRYRIEDVIKHVTIMEGEQGYTKDAISQITTLLRENFKPGDNLHSLRNKVLGALGKTAGDTTAAQSLVRTAINFPISHSSIIQDGLLKVKPLLSGVSGAVSLFSAGMSLRRLSDALGLYGKSLVSVLTLGKVKA
jgi:hypothetical protein